MRHLIRTVKVGQAVKLAELPMMTFYNSPRAPVRIEIAGRLITAHRQTSNRIRLSIQHVANEPIAKQET